MGIIDTTLFYLSAAYAGAALALNNLFGSVFAWAALICLLASFFLLAGAAKD